MNVDLSGLDELNAEELEETGQEIDFPAWWQAMITDAAVKMVKAKHYLYFELKEPAIDAFVDTVTMCFS
jgi:hypothetical protein